MHEILVKGVIHSGRVETALPINLPDGSEVIITGCASDLAPAPSDEDRPMTAAEIAETLAAMDRVQPFDMTEEERAAVDAWERKVNAYTIAGLDKGVEEVFP